jgi:hypothetical protein
MVMLWTFRGAALLEAYPPYLRWGSAKVKSDAYASEF